MENLSRDPLTIQRVTYVSLMVYLCAHKILFFGTVIFLLFLNVAMSEEKDISHSTDWQWSSQTSG